MLDTDSTQFGKGLGNALPDITEGIQTITEDAIEEAVEDAVDGAIEAVQAPIVPNLKQKKIAKLRAKLHHSRPYEDFKVTCKFQKIGYGLSVNANNKYYTECDDNDFYI